MAELFYNFTMDGENRGYSYLYQDEKSLRSLTRFHINAEEVFTNIFSLKFEGSRPLACKHNEYDWVDLSPFPQDHYPSCAYPLLLPKVHQHPYSYVQVSDDDGRVVAETVLRRVGNEIVELQADTPQRRFTMQKGIPIKIDWGGAISYLCSNAEESIAGCRLNFEI